MEKTKATMRAIREDCGITQAELADEFDVLVRTVKRWENPAHPSSVPDDVFEWLVTAHIDMHTRAIGIARSIAEEHGDGEIVLPYFRVQEDLDAVQLPSGQDQPVGYFNATMRKIADILAEMGLSVSFGYGDEATVVPFADLAIKKMLNE